MLVYLTQERPFTSIHFSDVQFKHLICNILHRWKYALMVKIQNSTSAYYYRYSIAHLLIFTYTY